MKGYFLFGVVSALSTIAQNVIDRVGKEAYSYRTTPSVDLTHTLLEKIGLPKIPLINHAYLADLAVYFCVGVSLLYSDLNFESFFEKCARVLFVRLLLISSTVMHASPRSVLGVDSGLGRFALNRNCYDMLFSGHSATCMVAGWHAFNGSLWSTLFWWFCVIAGPVLNVLVGDHYTVDAVLAYIMSV